METAYTIGEHLAKALNTWGVMPGPQEAKVYFTMDRGTNVKKAVQDATWAEFIPCQTHVLHRMVLEAIIAIGRLAMKDAVHGCGQADMWDVRAKVTKLAWKLHLSPNRTARFKAFQLERGWTPLQPITPCRTRWHGYKGAGIRMLQLQPRVSTWHDDLDKQELPWDQE